MKVVLLAGGFGTRISEETENKPKPMIEIGGRPILWHVMKLYSYYGFNEFVICAGYRQQVIKEWFANYFLYTSDITFKLANNNEMIVHNRYSEPWTVSIIDTGLNTMTGGRLKRIRDYVDNEPFLMTYGDGVSDVNIKELVSFHEQHRSKVTMTVVQPESRYGNIDFDGDYAKAFREKSVADSGWINAGFMVVEPEILDEISGDDVVFEREPLEKAADEGELTCYKHKGFWHCMDTLRDKQSLEKLIAEGKAPWMVWEH
ncbi:MAG: glucose-1-phosphate cytidylyltransferase [Lachnospiraceae bacterium]|nr:glucose-1-phosphate cytidylyltransferase [Lachnospiraceae bacterium]